MLFFIIIIIIIIAIFPLDIRLLLSARYIMNERTEEDDVTMWKVVALVNFSQRFCFSAISAGKINLSNRTFLLQTLESTMCNGYYTQNIRPFPLTPYVRVSSKHSIYQDDSYTISQFFPISFMPFRNRITQKHSVIRIIFGFACQHSVFSAFVRSCGHCVSVCERMNADIKVL